MSYYSSLMNASMHPLRKAYANFETDKQNCISLMQSSEIMYKQYVENRDRLERLCTEQATLLSIMDSDLTADLCVVKLQGD